ncbi:hypothetical protein CHUAL_001268 [Chamberlinius hualienensis]
MFNIEFENGNQSVWISLEKMFTSCRPLIVALYLVGVNLNISGKKRGSSWITRMLRFTVFSTASANFIYYFRTLLNGLGLDDLWILSFNDHIFVLTFLYVISFKELAINKLAIDIMNASITLAQNDVVFKKVRKMSCVVVFIPIGILIYMHLNVSLHVNFNRNCEQWFEHRYFGFTLSPFTRGLIIFLVEFSYAYTCYIVTIYVAFIVILIYMLSIAYENVNNAFEQLETPLLKDSENFQEQHLKLSRLIDQFNRLFSPAIFVLVILIFGQIIGTPGNFKAHVILYSVFPSTSFYATFMPWDNAIVPIVRSFYVFLLLFKTTHKVHHLSQKVFEKLLDFSTGHPEIYEESIKSLITHSNKANLFSAKFSTSPTAITASGLFTLDYPLIGLVFSITVTYWTIIEQFNNGNENTSQASNITRTIIVC